MARIKLSEGFTIIPEGTYVFKITKVEEDDAFGIITIHMVTPEGQTLRERFMLMDGSGNPVDGAINAFSYFAKTAMNNFKLTDIDPQELLGRYLKGTVSHSKVPNKKDPSKMNTYAHLDEKFPANAYDFGETPNEGLSTVDDFLEGLSL